MNLEHLLHPIVPFTLSNGTIEELRNIEITSVEMDSRKVISGSLFVCIVGFKSNGHHYIQQALDNGAVAIVVQEEVECKGVPTIKVPDSRKVLAILADRFYGYPTHKLKLIGVTGTNGKTTVTHLLERIFEAQGKKTGRIGTINMKIGDELIEVQNTTPESLELHRAFAKMIEKGSEYAVIEASSHALHMGRLRGSNFRTAIFTNLTQDHLDYHGTMEEYKRAKGLLFAQLGNSYPEDNLKFAVLNGDDEAHFYYKEITSAQVITYGIDNKNVDVWATNLQINSQGTAFTVETYTGTEHFQLKMLGKFNVYNCLAAISAGLLEGLTLREMKKTLEQMTGVRGRMEPVEAGQPFTAVVDYAHTPDSLENVLTTIKEFSTSGKIYCVIGCGGDRDRTKRPLMANIATTYADISIFTSDNPRSEEPEAIIQDMIDGVKTAEVPEEKYISIVDRKEAIHWAVKQAKENDIVLIAGKGHETYQMIKDQIIPFDDREVLIECIQNFKSE